MRRRIDIRIPFTDFSFIMISVLMILISMGYFEGKIGEKSYSKSKNEAIEKAEKENKSKIKELFKIDNKQTPLREKVEATAVHKEAQLNQNIKDDEKFLPEPLKTMITPKMSDDVSKEKEIEDINKLIEKDNRYNSQVDENEEDLSKHDYIDLR